jgi:hypothetical protein
MSFIKPIADVCNVALLVVSSRFAIKKRKRIKKIGKS